MSTGSAKASSRLTTSDQARRQDISMSRLAAVIAAEF